MKSISLFSIALLVLMSLNSFAQKVEMKWSPQMEYNNKLDGFYDDIVGFNSQYIYAKYSNLALSSKKSDKTVKLIAFDKNTMNKVKEVKVRDDNKTDASKYEDKAYYKTIVFEDVLYMFWTNRVKRHETKTELYVESFDGRLKKKGKLKKVYETDGILFVVGNKGDNPQILIGSEANVEKGESVRFEYKLLDADFSFSATNQVDLPMKRLGKWRGNFLSSDYEFGKDGNIYISTTMHLSREEIKALKKTNPNGASSFNMLTIVNVAEGSSNSYPINFENKKVFDFGYVLSDEGVKVYGLYCDLVKDSKANDLHGIFYSALPKSSNALENVKFSSFDKTFLDNLFAADKKDRQDRKLFKSKKKGKSEEESMPSNYIIEYVVSKDKDNIVLLCTRMQNYSVTTCTNSSDGTTSCTTRYYCEKSNVTAFKLDNTGEIAWASNLSRNMTYDGTSVMDIQAVFKGTDLYVTYGSAYSRMSEKENRKSKKSKEHRTNLLEYAVFDYETGDFRKNEYQINKASAKKKELKYISAPKIMLVDDKLYVHSSRIRYKSAMYAVCTASALCPPLGYMAYFYMMASGNSRIGVGNIGLIQPI